MEFRESPAMVVPYGLVELALVWASKVLEPHRYGTETAKLALQK